jgi:hypothetical protein
MNSDELQLRNAFLEEENKKLAEENRRIMELSLDVGHRPVVFIRFNPDQYYTGNNENEKVTSCWKINNSGICSVPANKKTEWKKRLHVLEEQICFWTNIENQTVKTVETVELFYDAYT